MGQEIAHVLRRSRIGRARSLIRCALHHALEFDARKHAVPGKVPIFHAHEDGRIGVAPLSGETTHTIDAYAALLGRRAHHLAARAHAKRIHAAPAFQVNSELIVRRAERRMRCGLAVLRTVDEFLGMLDAHAYGKRLAFHEKTRVMHRLKRIAR